MERKPKDDFHFEALGDTDELNSQLGVVSELVAQSAHAQGKLAPLTAQLHEIQSRLFDVGSHIATPLTSSNEKRIARTTFEQHNVDSLEQWIDDMDATLPQITNFVLPTGGLISAHLHVARTVARRAERKTAVLVRAQDVDPVVGRYLNRLSDFLFQAARFAAHTENKQEVLYQKAKTTHASSD
jgi:ATP:cob(I)alamin adenosyltransferase